MEHVESQVIALSILVQLSRRVREAATREEINFIAVNESKQLLSYRQAALWTMDGGVVSVSGIPEPDQSSPYVQWLAGCCKSWRTISSCRSCSPEDLKGDCATSWDEWAPLHGAVAPLSLRGGGVPLGLLVLFREEVWSDHELALLTELAAIYAHAYTVYAQQGGLWSKVRKGAMQNRVRISAALLALSALFLPVRMSVQAPAEVVAKEPFVVRSPLDTVIDRFYVKPNQQVAEGELLFEFDRTNLNARHGVASKAYQVAAEEYRQAAQTALVDDRSRADITPRRGKMEEKATELSFSRQLLKKTEVRAPRSGIVIFAEQSDWIGKNVSIGERVLSIADPQRVEMLIRLPVADAIEFALDNQVRLYLASDPQHPLNGVVRHVSYKPETTPAGIAAYRLKADFSNHSPVPRIGLTGTVRIYGKKVSLGYYLFRRPITAFRQRLGW